MVASRGVGVVAGGVFVGASVGVAFVILDIDDNEVAAGFSGGNVARGLFFGVRCPAIPSSHARGDKPQTLAQPAGLTLIISQNGTTTEDARWNTASAR